MNRYQWLFTLTRRLWALVALVLVMLAVVVALGRQLIPLVADHRAAIDAYFSEQLGVRVQSQRLMGEWSGLSPSLHGYGLTLAAEATPEQPALVAAEIVAQLDLVQTLWQRQPVWRELRMRDIFLGLEQDADGTWHIRHLPLQRTREQNANLDGLLDLLLYSANLEIQQANLQLHFHNGDQVRLGLSDIRLENTSDFHRLTASLDLDTQQDVLLLVLEAHHDPRDRENFFAEAYVRFNRLQLTKPFDQLFARMLPGAANWDTDAPTLDAEFWLNSRSPGRLQLAGFFDLSELPLQGLAQVPPLTAIGAQVNGEFRAGEQWRVNLTNAQFDWGDWSPPPMNAALIGYYQAQAEAQADAQAQAQPPALTVALERVALRDWLGQIQQYPLLPERLAEVLTTLEPRGELRNLYLDLFPGREDFRIRANLVEVAANAWQGVPAVDQLNGYLESDKRHGRVDIDSQQGFSVHFPLIYQQPMAFDSARGQVAWEVVPAANDIRVYSGPLHISAESGQARGHFLLEAQLKREEIREPWMFLEVGLENSQAQYRHKYVPFTVADDLKDWLDRAVLGGDLINGGFIFRGSLRDGRRDHRTVQLFLNVRNGTLAYHPDWPLLNDVDATVTVDDALVRAHANRGRLLDSQVQALDVTVADGAVAITGGLQGPATDALALVRGSPLNDRLGDYVAGWQAQGAVTTQVELDLPLNDLGAGRQQVNLTFAGVDLLLPEAPAAVADIRGTFSYDSRRGLWSEDLRGLLFEQPLTAEISTDQDQGETVSVALSGRLAVPQLRRLLGAQAWLDLVEGSLPFTAAIDFSGNPARTGFDRRLRLNSTLEGMAVALPAPFGKTAAAQRPLSVTMPRHGNRFDIRVNYDELVAAHLRGRGEQLQRGTVALNAAVNGLPDQGQLLVRGQLPRLEPAQWQRLASTFDRSMTGGGVGLAPQFDLHMDRLLLAQWQLDDLHLGGGYGANGWDLQVRAPLLAGRVRLPPQGAIALDLDYLRLPEPAPAAEGDAAAVSLRERLAGLDFAQLPLLDFATDELTLGEQTLGSLAFRLQPEPPSVLRLTNLEADMRGLVITGSEEGEGADIIWDRRDGERSHFHGIFRAGDLAVVMYNWGLEPALESQQAFLYTDVHWPGNPAALTEANVAGSLGVEINRGRFFQGGGGAGNDIMRLLGLFNIDTWARRLRFDFSDISKSGTSFDRISGEMALADGRLQMDTPLRVRMPSGRLQMTGTVDLLQKNIDGKLVATLPVNENLTWVTALAAGLPAAIGVWVASQLFSEQVDNIASLSYDINGSWEDPDIEFQRAFDSTIDNNATANPVIEEGGGPAEEAP